MTSSSSAKTISCKEGCKSLVTVSEELEDAEDEFWNFFLDNEEVANPEVSRHPSGEAVYACWEEEGLKKAVYALKSGYEKVSLGLVVTEKVSPGRPREFRLGMVDAAPGDIYTHLDYVYGALESYGREDLLEVEETFL